MSLTANNQTGKIDTTPANALYDNALQVIGTKTEAKAALARLEKSAEAGDVEAQYALARFHLLSPLNTELVNKLCNPYLANAVNRKGCYTVDELVAWISICSGFELANPTSAYDWLRKAAMQQHPATIELLALIYRYGMELPGASSTLKSQIAKCSFQRAITYFDNAAPDYDQGMDYLWSAIKLDDQLAKQRWEVAFLQFTFPEFIGRGNEEACFKFAFEWCEKRLREVPDDYEAIFAMGVLLAFGKGCNANPAIAETLFQRNHGEGNSVRLAAECDPICCMASFYLARSRNWGNRYAYLDPNLAELFKADLQAQKMQINPNLVIPALIIDFSISFNDQALLEGFLNSLKQNRRKEHAALQLSMRDKLSQALLEAVRQKTEALSQKQRAESAERELEETMAMFAHKFRSPLDAIIYNTSHEHQPKLYVQAAQTMRGLLDIFSIISTDADTLQPKLKQDCRGNGNLTLLFSKTLDMILLHLLSVSATEKIQQHYLHYAKAHNLCAADLTYKAWNEEHFELERQLQSEWEQSYAQPLSESATLEQRLAWLEPRFFKLELRGFERADIQFKEYGITESFLTILLNELLVNAFKYYASAEAQPVVLEWLGRDGFQVLSCRNPSLRGERDRLKGSGKGHTFLSALARITGSQFSKPKPQDDYVVEFAIADQLLISS